MSNLNLTDEQIAQNQEDFLNILIPAVETREGSKAELLQKILINSDFFTAPASTVYHGSCKGGLCQHSLNVYYNMCKLVVMLGLEEEIPRDKVAIVALLHDLSKRNFYETYAKNSKVYSESGSKKDELGRFDWVSTQGYKTKENIDRFIYGNHEATAEFMVRQFVPLTPDESIAILHHMGGLSKDSTSPEVIAQVYNVYKIALLLHQADMLATYIHKF